MAWVRIDDQVPRHDKMLRAGPAACWLWVCGNCHAQSQLTDGFIGDDALPFIGLKSGYKSLARILVSAGLWERESDGYVIHDYHDHNRTRAETEMKKAATKEQRRKAGIASGERRRADRDRRLQNEQTMNGLVQHPVQHNANERSQALTNPDPTRPDPTEEERSAAATPRSVLAMAPNANGNYRVIEALACELRKAGFWEVGEGVRFEIQSEAELVHAVKDVCAQKRITYGSGPDVAVDTVHRACASAWAQFEKRAARA